MRALLVLTAPSLLFVAGCVGENKDDDGTTETGETAEPIVYEEGCILVDGGQGFAYLADAYTVVPEGGEITLCEGTLDETLVITKSVKIVGPGVDLLTWNAPVNQAAIQVQGAAQVQISGVGFTSTRNAVEIEGASGVTLSDVSFDSVGNTAIKVIDSEDVIIENATFTTPAYGAVSVEGGSATVRGSVMESPVGFGVYAQDGANVTVETSTISGTVYTNADEGLIDGFALWAVGGSTLTTNGNTLTDNVVQVWGDDADISLSGDVLTGGFYGVVHTLGAFSIEGSTVQDAYWTALRIITPDDILIANTEIIGTPELVAADPYNFTNYIGGGATLATDGTITISDVNLTGYNALGMIVLGYNEAPTIVAERLNIVSPGRYGLRMHGADATFTDVSVIDMRLVDDPATVNASGSYDTGFAVSLWECNTRWTGGAVTGSELIGMLNYAGSLQLTGTTHGDHGAFGLWNYEGTAYVSGATFTDSPSEGGVANYTGSLTLDSSTFIDNIASYTYEYSYDDGNGGTVTYAYEYSHQSQDVICYSATSCELTNNTFSNGSAGVQVSYSSNVLIEGNTWTDYQRYPVYLYSQTDPVELKDNTFKDIGYYAVYCSSGAVEAEGLLIDGIVSSMSEVVYYTDGVETGGYTYSSSGQALYLNNCSFAMRDSAITGANYHAMYAYDSAIELIDVTVQDGSSAGSSSYGTLRAQWSATQPSFYAAGLTVSGTTYGDGLQLYGAGRGGVVELSDLTLTNNQGRGMLIQGLPDASLSDVTATGNGSDGAFLEAMSGELFGENTFSSNGRYGLYVDGRLDYDKDGYTIGEGDCDDTSASRYPGATESTNRKDDDCDGIADGGTDATDYDGDGYSAATGDCDDTTTATYPGGPETTLGVDNDCDGLADEGVDGTLEIIGVTASSNKADGVSLVRVMASVEDGVMDTNVGWGLACAVGDELEGECGITTSGNGSGGSSCDVCE
ncbi:MAG: right-handed parallel beta-helix repeat-containing protein [Deltaproteobacteria bacterium]|nr:right-handed parallel beta-helix repeat-containing protein [Deltaproteobacteria bacterium]